MPVLYVALVVLVVLACWAVITYNRLVREQNMLREAWSGIDVQLKRRHDLIPNIVAAVKGYSEYEREVQTGVAALRQGTALESSDPQARAQAETALTKTFKTLFAVAEAYPDLKASQVYLSLQQSLTDVENDIQYARRYYNGTVRDMNILVESFPSSLVAGAFAFQRRDYFEIELATERDVPTVQVS